MYGMWREYVQVLASASRKGVCTVALGVQGVTSVMLADRKNKLCLNVSKPPVLHAEEQLFPERPHMKDGVNVGESQGVVLTWEAEETIPGIQIHSSEDAGDSSILAVSDLSLIG
jgi:hypothetical protein